MPQATEPLTIPLDGGTGVSGLSCAPASPRACCVLAHGAGAGMTHPFLEALAEDLAARRVMTMRYQFPYMERGARHPDTPAVAQAAVRAAVAAASERAPGLPLFAGGKSFGGRMTSLAQAQAPLPGVRGLAFLGFPLHPAGRPSAARGAHLEAVGLPMLFLQGTRDALADLALLRPLVEHLGPRATLAVFDGADHGFHVPARSGRTDARLRTQIADALLRWMEAVLGDA